MENLFHYSDAGKEHLHQLENFFDVHLDLLCIADPDGNFIKVNKEWENILGYSKQELEHRKFLDFVHPDDIPETLAAMSKLSGNEEILNFVNRYRCSDGTYRYIEWRSRPIDGLIYAAARDISERRRLENVWKASERNFRTFFETIDDMIFIANKSGRIFFCNGAVTRKLGYELEELSQMHVLDVHPEGKRAEAEKIFSEMFAGIRDYCPLPLQKKDGGYLPVETRVWFGTWDGDECIFGISKDLSAQQAALDKFHKLFDNNPALMAVSNAADNIFVDVNDAFLSKLGYAREEIIGKTSTELNLFVENEKQLAAAKQLKKDGRIQNIELEVRKKNGDIMIGLFSGEVIDNQAEKSFLTVMTDMTEQKKAAEEIMKAKEQAEVANNMKSQFLATMSHEIRTPMNGIMGYLDLLNATGLNQDQSEYLSDAKTASKMLLYLINDILDFSKIEAGKLSIEKTPFLLRNAIIDTVSLHALKAGEKGLKLLTEIDEHVPEAVIGDPTRLKQVIHNLVSNAVKFTEKGEVKVKVGSRKGPGNSSFIDFEVSDTGIGIEEQALKRLFKPFTQADSSTTRKFGGTGLGLAISSELVRLMGGDISVESAPNKGAIFRFSICLEISDGEAGILKKLAEIENNRDAAKLSQNTKNSMNARILLVEDNEMNRDIVITVLRHNNLTCDTAADGAEAVRAVKEKEYDIIFMDCQMPVMDGYESTRRIREIEAGKRHTMIVAMTANAMEGDRKKCIDAGMDDYLAKPLNLNLVLKKIEECSAQRSAASEKRQFESGSTDDTNPLRDEHSDGNRKISLLDQYIGEFIKIMGLSREEAEPIFTRFIDQLPDLISNLELVLSERDYEKLAAAAHQLKGVSGNLRIDSLYNLAVELESGALTGNGEKCSSLVSEIRGLI